MSLINLPFEVILKIIDIPWGKTRGKNKQIKIDYNHKNPYNSLIKVSD